MGKLSRDLPVVPMPRLLLRLSGCCFMASGVEQSSSPLISRSRCRENAFTHARLKATPTVRYPPTCPDAGNLPRLISACNGRTINLGQRFRSARKTVEDSLAGTQWKYIFCLNFFALLTPERWMYCGSQRKKFGKGRERGVRKIERYCNLAQLEVEVAFVAQDEVEAY